MKRKSPFHMETTWLNKPTGTYLFFHSIVLDKNIRFIVFCLKITKCIFIFKLDASVARWNYH